MQDPAPRKGKKMVMDKFYAQQARFEERASAASEPGLDALNRLLVLAENRSSGQIETIAQFLGAIWNGRRHFDLYDLRRLDVEISDDMLVMLDMLRWGRVSIDAVAGRRIENVLKAWDMYGPDQTGQFICTSD
jgi:hypothetical protein